MKQFSWLSSRAGFLGLGFLFVAFLLISRFSFINLWDTACLHAIQQVNAPFFTYGFVPFVIAGSIEIGVSVPLIFSIWLYRKREFQKAYLILSALLIASAFEYWLKQVHYHPPVPFDLRGRFPLIPMIGSIDIETNYSFPSGHSFRSMFLFGILYLWTRKLRHPIFLGFVFVYAVLQWIGMNYYGFHWTSDVVAGYLLALIALSGVRRCVQK